MELRAWSLDNSLCSHGTSLLPSVLVWGVCIFGSYIPKEKDCLREREYHYLDTLWLLRPASLFSRHVCLWRQSRKRSGLVFITLPNIFNVMPAGQLWGIAFMYLWFCCFVYCDCSIRNILSFGMDLFGWTRRKAVLINFFATHFIAPCALGFNVWSGFAPLEKALLS